MRPGEPARTIRGKKRSFRDNLDGSGRDKVRRIFLIYTMK
jgi:hypothetical protein